MLNSPMLLIFQHFHAIPLRSPLTPSGSSPDGEPRIFCRHHLNQKADPVSESANPSSQHQLYGSIVPIWTERRKVDLGWLLVIRLGCISPSAYYLHKMLQEQ